MIDNRFRRTALAFLFLAAGLSLPSAAWSEYMLASGDVVELSVTSLPDLRQRSRVDPTGEVSFAYLGQLKAAGRPISALRADIRRLLPGAAIRRTLADKLDIVVINAAEITVDVAEYRPVYITGDISKPGDQAFRPGLTVRQAVALAGGYDLLRFRADRDPVMQVSELRSEYQTHWMDYARAQVKIWRVKAELGNGSELKERESEIDSMPLPRSVRLNLLQSEREKLAANVSTFIREEAALTRQMKQSQDQSALVMEQVEKIREGISIALEETARAQDLVKRGLAPASRLADERRMALMQQTQSLQATERLGQITREREDLARKLDVLREQRKATLRQELDEANTQLELARIKLQGADEKLTYAGLLRSQLTNGKGSSPSIVIYRDANGTSERLAADEGTQLLPGDTVEVTLQSNPDAGSRESSAIASPAFTARSDSKRN